MPESGPWAICEEKFPAEKWPYFKLEFLVNYAVLAPSSHNTQPWDFLFWNEEVDLRADRSRALPVVDPHDRELTISCGAALGMLRVALRYFGYAGEIERFPKPEDPDLLARIGLGPHRTPAEEDQALFHAIPHRRTTRSVFEDRPLPAALLEQYRYLATREGCELRLVTSTEEKAALAALVAEGDRVQWGDPSFRRELALWIHSHHDRRQDGISAEGFGLPDILSPVGAWVLRTFDLGDGVAAKDQAIAEGSPVLAVLLTHGDNPKEWLRAGEALAHVLLAATAEGVTASYLNQPIEVPALRWRLRETLQAEGVPQLLLRLGYGPAVPPAVRRPVGEVVSSVGMFIVGPDC